MQTLFPNYTSLRSSRYSIYLHGSHQNEIDISCVSMNIYIIRQRRESELGYHNKQSVKSCNIIIRVRTRHFEVVITF